MKIPKSFELSRIKWEVKHLDHLWSEHDTRWFFGDTYHPLKRIRLAKYGLVQDCPERGKKEELIFKISNADVEQTFYHELVHAILYDMAHELSDNEVFVDAFSKRLWEFERTKC